MPAHTTLRAYDESIGAALNSLSVYDESIGAGLNSTDINGCLLCHLIQTFRLQNLRQFENRYKQPCLHATLVSQLVD